ncbi:YwiC-like family protein [Paenibacillus chibensis]|uniref:YwiC-like family protein n=1 Tax=Paenibacillus chibensis TaxID=59846 RepID=UPI000FDC3319|nr:YwiC-like family protein [Paenibacillus chibensis]MEC0369466.1 YwiC-like family protein [Paenibacillus chibensis]
MKKTSIVIPREHGGWAMVSMPFIIAMMATQPVLLHLPLFLAWFFLYLASYPLLQSLKKTAKRSMWLTWGAGYAFAAVLFLIPVLLKEPWLFWFAPVLMLLLMVNIWHVRHKSERALLNDMCAILLFCSGGAAAFMLGGGTWGRELFEVLLFNFLYFMGTVFFVKSVFRERKNKRWTAYAVVYHTLALAVPLFTLHPWMCMPFLYPLIKTVIYAGKPMKPMKVGVMEIIGSVQFLILSLILL